MPSARHFDLRELRQNGDPLALVALYALGAVGSIVWTALLPGEPSYGERRASLVIALALSTLLVFLIARRSAIAWRFAVFAHGFAMVFAAASAGSQGFGTKALGLAIIQAVTLTLLFSPALERHVGAFKSRRRRR